jgi:hypothetical protein
MTFDPVRLGLPNLAAVLAMAVVPVVSLTMAPVPPVEKTVVASLETTPPQIVLDVANNE